jgi:hypothetical protein
MKFADGNKLREKIKFEESCLLFRNIHPPFVYQKCNKRSKITFFSLLFVDMNVNHSHSGHNIDKLSVNRSYTATI